MSLIGVFMCLSIPFTVLKSPCEPLAQIEILYKTANLLERYMPMIDRTIISLVIMLAIVSLDELVDAIIATSLTDSPWIEKGLYRITKTFRMRTSSKAMHKSTLDIMK
ncbi:unnamed protein product [Leptidea sinapis]|uniref:Uncharacterized protein n=1 Tax=Leptidea sinapis TaxID=189913 RepID=A0A5E4QD89_9NEOP|nr:unnamed protein product [Leptidea sinapis]